jgi:hypothetical protein
MIQPYDLCAQRRTAEMSPSIQAFESTVANSPMHSSNATSRWKQQENGKRSIPSSTARGHWGLRGMAERAEKIGANFDYKSAPGEGVKIRLVLPASQAYIRAFGFKAIFHQRNWN